MQISVIYEYSTTPGGLTGANVAPTVTYHITLGKNDIMTPGRFEQHSRPRLITIAPRVAFLATAYEDIIERQRGAQSRVHFLQN